MVLPTSDLVTNPEALGYGALIDYGPNADDKLYLRLGVGPGREMQVQTQQPEDLPGIGRDNPEDYTGDIGRTFSRNRFAGGEGLDIAHRRDGTDTDFARYWDSKGMHVAPADAGVPEVLELAHETSQVETSTDSNLYVAKIGSVLYMSEGSNIRRTANLGSSFTTSARGGAITGLGVIGDELYAGVGTDIEKRTGGGSWSTWSDVNNDRIWAAKDRILAADGVSLYEAAAGAGSVLIHTLPTGASWTSVVDAGSAILAAATTGTIYAFIEEEGNLVLKGQTDLVKEEPRSLGYLQGIVLIGTGQATTTGATIGRLWRAQLVGVRLQAGQVLRTWREGAIAGDRAPQFIHTTREFAYVGLGSFAGSSSELWKYMAETDGITKELDATPNVGFGTTLGITDINERLFYSVGNSGLHREEQTYEPTGYLITPMADFFSSQVKNWVGARLDAEAVITQEEIVVSYSNDPAALTDPTHSSWTAAVSVAGGGVTKQDAEQALISAAGRYLIGKIELTSSTDQVTTPTAFSFGYRVLATTEDEVIQIPVNISDQIEIPHRKRLVVRGEGNRIWQQLRAIQGEDVRLKILRPTPLEVRGVLQSVSTPITSISERGSTTVYCLIAVRGITIA